MQVPFSRPSQAPQLLWIPKSSCVPFNEYPSMSKEITETVVFGDTLPDRAPTSWQAPGPVYKSHMIGDDGRRREILRVNVRCADFHAMK
jgi:hypothetical protein